MSKMFQPLALKGHIVKNRFVLPPGVRFDTSITSGVVNDATVLHYKQAAQAGFGTIIVEANAVSEGGRITPTQLGIWDDSFIEGLARLPAAIHSEGALALVQLVYSGVKTQVAGQDIVAPSVYTYEENTSRALSTEEISAITQQFIAAGLRAKQAGFDGVELHGCHAYLINQFLSPTINKREDAYGQDRAKFALDILTGLRQAVGNDFIISVRMPGNDPDITTCISHAKRFQTAGADILHVSAGFTQGIPTDLGYKPNEHYNWIVATAIEIKKHVDIPVIAVNGIRTPDQAAHILDTQSIDMVAIFKAYLCDPAWIEKARTGQPISPKCVSCQPRCLRFTGINNCIFT